MAGEIEDRGGAQVHWLVAGKFGLGERKKTLALTRADFDDALKSRGIEIVARVPDAVGSDETRTYTLKVESLKHLTLKHVVGAIPELTELAAKADQVAKLKDPSVDSLREVVGEGK
ncbi:MAG TPA: hypothetical protein DEF51_25205, partial [Myxococcales bacterium]|nr:hypothetical protein [Myxococcales bacterium]